MRLTKSIATVAGAAIISLGLGLGASGTADAAGKYKDPNDYEWSFSGPFGTFDRAQLQRGFKVYKEVCASCHAMSQLSYRNLVQPGGPEFTEDEAKVLAQDWFVQDGPDEFGDMFERPAVLSDKFFSPFPNEQAAKAANNGAYPPDLSVMAKARKNGANYIASLLIGYESEMDEHFELGDGLAYNPYFPGQQLAMAQPLYEESIEYTDGTPMTVEQYSKDVTAFLMWAAEPALEDRNRMGLQVLIFLAVFAGLLYLSKEKIWRDIKH